MQLWQDQKMSNLYTDMWKIIFRLVITFPISYLIEAYFSAVNSY